MYDKILQIMPAPGWRAAYANADGSIFADELVGWALCQVHDVGRSTAEEVYALLLEEETYVIVGDPDLQAVNFLGFVPPGGSLDEYEEQAKKYAAKRKAAENTHKSP